MKPIAPEASFQPLQRTAVSPCSYAERGVEDGVEAGYMTCIRKELTQTLYPCQVSWVVQRRKVAGFLHRADDLLIDQSVSIGESTTVHDSMSDQVHLFQLADHRSRSSRQRIESTLHRARQRCILQFKTRGLSLRTDGCSRWQIVMDHVQRLHL